MAVGYHAICTGAQYATTEVTASTNKRDVSELLDLWAHKETPFLNRIAWGPESGGTQIEWISEHIGYGYINPASVMASAGGSVKVGSSGLASAGLAIKQINTGALLFGYQSAQSEVCLMLVTDVCGDNTLLTEFLLPTACAALSLATTDKLYIVGNVANEGSDPRADTSRARSVITNNMSILRKDVQITGSMMATDMYAVSSELQHQISLRLKEMQKEREMMILLAATATRSATVAGIFNGMYGFMEDQSGDHVVTTSQALTEDSVNDVVAELYENGANPNCLVGATKQIRKFTEWDRDRIRTRPSDSMGGAHITSYLTDVGIEIDLLPMRHFPHNIAYCLDTDIPKMRAKKGRKLILEKLGKAGDYDRWQMISEFSFECKGYDKGQVAMWSKLSN